MVSEVTMKKKMKIDHFVLRRLHPQLGEIITWEVLSKDEKLRLGVIRKVNDTYLTRKFGWKVFKVQYWMGSSFYHQAVAVHPTQRGVLKQLWNHYYKED